jgi:hypothetical protein
MQRLIKAAIIALELLGLCAAADAQVYPLHYAHTEKRCNTSSCEIVRTHVYGSAVCVGRVPGWQRKWFIVTAAHNITPGVTPNVWDGVAWVPAKVLEIDRDRDICLLGIETLQNMKFLPVARRRPLAGHEVRIFAFIKSDQRVQRASFVSQRRWIKPYLFSVTGAAAHGNSGGAVIYQGELSGLIVMKDDGINETLVVDGPTIYAWLIERNRFTVEATPPVNTPPPPAAATAGTAEPPGQDVPAPRGRDCGCPVAKCQCRELSDKLAALSGELRALSGERDRLSGELAALETQRRKIEIRTYQGKRPTRISWLSVTAVRSWRCSGKAALSSIPIHISRANRLSSRSSNSRSKYASRRRCKCCCTRTRRGRRHDDRDRFARKCGNADADAADADGQRGPKQLCHHQQGARPRLPDSEESRQSARSPRRSRSRQQ